MERWSHPSLPKIELSPKRIVWAPAPPSHQPLERTVALAHFKASSTKVFKTLVYKYLLLAEGMTGKGRIPRSYLPK